MCILPLIWDTFDARVSIKQDRNIDSNLEIMPNNNITTEPPWAGIGRTIENGIFWVALTLVLIPIPLGAFFCGLWWLVTGEFGNFLICYSIAIITGSIPFLKKMEKEGRIYIIVESQTVTIVTNDLPATQEREASDSREETPLHGFKLGEGFHILNLFDQKYATVAIELEYQVQTDEFRVTIGGNKMRDLIVKSAIAEFKTDSEHVLALARIDSKGDGRKTKIENRMKAFMKRFIEEEFRRIASTPAGSNTDPAEKSSDVSDAVQGRLERLIEDQFPGFELKSFTLGNIDKPKDVENARDKAAAIEELTGSARNMMTEMNTATGAPQGGELTPEQAVETALIAAGLKQANVTGFSINPATINAIGSVAVAIVNAFKTPPTPPPSNP
jgi:hypothetical protein